jgi:hypothetical protein
MKLEDDALKLLQSMKRTDGKKYTAGAINRTRYHRLEQAGLIKGTPTNISDVIYMLLPAADEHLAQ